MKKNRTTRIFGKNVLLVPYKKKHVPRYHEWMKSQELRYFTGSEPLTLSEEYAMQQKWLEDEDKCTFIILDRKTFEDTENETDAMIGDTNLFFNDPDDPSTAEAEIMIAELESRGKRRGWEAMILMFLYGVEELSVKKYMVKIVLDNEKSIRMFQKLGFREISRSDVFREITLEKDIDEGWINWLRSETSERVRDELYKEE